MSLEYYAPHQDPEGKTTEGDDTAASTTTLEGLVIAVQRKLVETFDARVGFFRPTTLPGRFILSAIRAQGGVGIAHRWPIRGASAIASGYQSALNQISTYRIFGVPEGLSSSVSVQVQETHPPPTESLGRRLLGGGGPSRPTSSEDIHLGIGWMMQQLDEAAQLDEAVLAEEQLGLDIPLSEAGAARLLGHIIAAQLPHSDR